MNELIGGAVWLFVACFAGCFLAAWLWQCIKPANRHLPSPTMKVAEFSTQWTSPENDKVRLNGEEYARLLERLTEATELIRCARADFVHDYDPQDGTDFVTPYDAFLYTAEPPTERP